MIDIYEIPTLPMYSLRTSSPTSGGLWPLAARCNTVKGSLYRGTTLFNIFCHVREALYGIQLCRTLLELHCLAYIENILFEFGLAF